MLCPTLEELGVHIHGPEGAAQEEAPAGPGHTCLGRAEGNIGYRDPQRPYNSYCQEIRRGTH